MEQTHHLAPPNQPEVDDLVASLPKQKGILEPYTYQYQGFWFPDFTLAGIIDFCKHFQPKENDIILVTAPKSSTTWLKAIAYALINRQAHPPQHPRQPLLTKTPHQLVPFIELLKPSEYDSVCNSSDSNCRILACHIPITHILRKSILDDSLNCKVVYMCRDIKDTFVSLFHFANKAKMRPSPISLEEAFDLYCLDVNGYGPVWDQILGYWKESLERPRKVMFMRYEDLKNDPHFQFRRLANFLGKPFSEEEEKSGLVDQIINLCSFEYMSKLEANKTGNLVQNISNSSFFRSGIVGGWKKYLTVEMAAKLDQITGEKFRGSGLNSN